MSKQKGISGKGKGKWQTLNSLKQYRQKRNKANRVAKRSRRG